MTDSAGSPRVRKAILRTFDAGSYTATVQPDGSLATYLAAIPVSRAIPAGELVTGRIVAIVLFDAGNPDDSLVVAVH